MKPCGTTTSPFVRRARVFAPAAAVAAAALAAGCWTDRAPAMPRSSSTPVPGTLWVTPAQPWRANMVPRRIIAGGDAALLGRYDGVIVRFDLAQGKPVRERVLTELSIEELVELPGGGWLAVGRKDKHTVAATIDPVTLEAKVVVSGIDGKVSPDGLVFTYAHGGGAAVLDEGVAIAGQGLPLAIYDPRTWKVRRIVDPAIGWSRPAGAGQTLYAYGKGGLRRFDLATGQSVNAGTATYYLATATHLVTRSLEKGRWVLDVESGGKKTRLPTGAYEAALDVAGGRLAVRDRAAIRVYALDGTKLVGTHDLGESGYGVASVMAFDGNRLVASTSSVVRVIDLATGAITPGGEPPYHSGEQLAVSADGIVQQLGTHVVRIVDGKVASSARLESDRLIAGGPHEVARHGVIRKSSTNIVELFAAGAPAPVGSWRLDGDVGSAWLGGSGDVVMDTTGIHAQHALYRGSGRRLEKLVPLHLEATVHDVDVDAGVALIGMKTTAHLVRLRDATALHALPHANCAEYPTAVLERGGDRVYLQDEHDIVVYRRTTGALVGAARIAGAGVVAFVRGHDELLIGGAKALHLWNPRTGELRTQSIAWSVEDVQVSPDARRAALSFGEGRIALVDLEVLRAAMTPGRATGHLHQPSCESADPLDVEPTEPEESSEHDDPGDLVP